MDIAKEGSYGEKEEGGEKEAAGPGWGSSSDGTGRVASDPIRGQTPQGKRHPAPSGCCAYWHPVDIPDHERGKENLKKSLRLSLAALKASRDAIVREHGRSAATAEIDKQIKLLEASLLELDDNN